MKYIKHIILIGGLLALFVLASGCSPSNVDNSSAGTPSTGGTGGSTASALILSATTTSVAPGASTLITARVVDSLGNNVADGTTVTFSFKSGDQVKASLSGSSATTVSGLASITFTATILTNAIAVVNASSGSATGNISITITTGGGGTTAGGSATVTATPAQIPVGSTSSINATVMDGSGNPVAGATVNFSLSNANGTLSAASAVTNASGVSAVTLTGATAGQVTVTAAVPSLPGVQGQVVVTVQPASTVNTLTVSASATTMLTNSSITISVLLSGPSLTVSGQTIAFSLSNPAAGTLSLVSVPTDAFGVASVTLTSLNLAGPLTVSASCASLGLSGSVAITITAPPPDNVNVVANPASISVFGTTTITATVQGGGQNVPDGTPVTFILSDGTFGSLSSTTGSTVNGKATTAFVAVGKAGSVAISAVAGTVSNSVTVSVTPAATGSIQFVSATPQVIGIQGSGATETSTVIFAVKDINGMPVVDGTLVDFSMQGPGGNAYIGQIVGATTTSSGTVSGNASVILHSGTAAGPVTIIASTTVVGGITISSSASQISIGGGVPSATHFNLAASRFNLPGLVVSNSQSNISAYIADRFGNYNVLKGTSVSFYTEAGAIDRQGTTDSTGKTTVIFRTQAPSPAQVSIWGPAHSPYDEMALINYLDLASEYNAGIPVGDAIHPRNGWVNVLAAVQGEESFLDENGDGLFNRSISNTSACPAGYTCECDTGTLNTYAGCITSQSNGFRGGTGHCIEVAPLTGTAATCAAAGFAAGSSRSEGFIDIGEPFIDVNDDGCRNDGNQQNCGGNTAASTDPFELYIDSNPVNGAYDPPNGMWDGPSCKTTGCQTSKMIWTSIMLSFTGNAHYCEFAPANFVGNIPYGSFNSFSFMVGDVFTNALVSNTKISIAMDTAASGAKLTGQTGYTIPDGNPFGPAEVFFTVSAPPACTCSPTPCTCTNPPPAAFSITATVDSTEVVGCVATLNGTFGP